MIKTTVCLTWRSYNYGSFLKKKRNNGNSVLSKMFNLWLLFKGRWCNKVEKDCLTFCFKYTWQQFVQISWDAIDFFILRVLMVNIVNINPKTITSFKNTLWIIILNIFCIYKFVPRINFIAIYLHMTLMLIRWNQGQLIHTFQLQRRTNYCLYDFVMKVVAIKGKHNAHFLNCS